MPITNKNPVGGINFSSIDCCNQFDRNHCNPNLNSINPDTGRVTKLELMNK
ncbi:predicted protein [Arabidopsis lyrata subsp. lyrata]|uniref:Predicted protein n=1 Tax=Arabidopsis lyrata subsp. lyrata TaxID=81972 RepID=D7MT64_ARALL|nr:predicted protein [Arabidopsis lyrata subsp. lyrata]